MRREEMPKTELALGSTAGKSRERTPMPRRCSAFTDAQMDTQVIAAIRANHLKANIGWIEDLGKRPRHPATGCAITIYWKRAWVDPGGTVFGSGPYLHVPIRGYWGVSSKAEETVHRVYPPARLRRKLVKADIARAHSTLRRGLGSSTE
jgi:hypothetical protein